MTTATNTDATLILDLPDPAVSDRDPVLRTSSGEIVAEWSYDHSFLEALGLRWELDGELVYGGLNYFSPR